ncbi:Crp/Fnr family transcriptional regulator [Arsenicibacter rosenii]|uniref:Cyclic nucleotide-binding protein n=1 Tax=Arsenicibacter rosenii TaxID=1750698 RepID=A0A1S2VMJ6_9BACT|nr:Crp/Fnr family transcriptional regulator [Arsenicibacter rosenii]OIN59416.1 cyclic nucleotide-binding protein [Arsenicibacter rosenii]
MNLQPLTDHFESYLPLTDSEKQLLNGRVSERHIRRRQSILQEGFPCKQYTFVVKGCFRMFAVDTKGVEHNILFAAENERPEGRWIADIGSFHAGTPSGFFIEAIEPSVILQIEQQDLYFLYLNIPKLDRIFKVIVENKFVELQNRILQTISSTAQERYLSFLKQYPALARRLPNVQIASYLGITPEFLSKIRKELAAAS